MQPNHQHPQEFSNLCFSGISQKYSSKIRIGHSFFILLKPQGFGVHPVDLENSVYFLIFIQYKYLQNFSFVGCAKVLRPTQ